MDFTYEKYFLNVNFNKEIQIQTSWIYFLPFDWEIRKSIWLTVLTNSGLANSQWLAAMGFPSPTRNAAGRVIVNSRSLVNTEIKNVAASARVLREKEKSINRLK